MTDKTLKQTIDKANIMAKLIKPEQGSDEFKSKDFDDVSSKAINFINGRSGERGFCLTSLVAGRRHNNLKPVDSSVNQPVKKVQIADVLCYLDKAFSLVMRSLNEISTHPGTEDFRHESVDDLSLELQIIRAKVQDNTYQKYLTKRFTGVVIKIDLDITSPTESSVTVEIARSEEIKNKSRLEVIHGFTYYF